jgi:hypothetical protein
VAEAKKPGTSAYARERLEEMLHFLTIASGLFDELAHTPVAALKGIARVRGKLQSILGLGTGSPRK